MKRLAALVLCLLVLAGCAQTPAPSEITTSTTAQVMPETTSTTLKTQTTTTSETQTTTTAAPPEPDVTITLGGVGDILLHSSVSRSCKTDAGYDFTRLFETVAPLIRSFDLAFVNQEVMLTGKVENYPRFAAPFEVADALKWAGFDVVNVATNHSLDQGEKGFLSCLDALRQRDLVTIGGAASQAEADEETIIEVNGVRIGFLSYTYDFNGFSLPSDKPWMINQIEEGRIRADARSIRPKCDLLVVSMHWGVEYSHDPSSRQRKLAQLLCDEGADVIIGTHPHVLQPAEWLESANGHRCFCAYSLGNYVSGQTRLAAMLGGILELTITFSPSLELKSIEGGIIPIVTQYEAPRTGHRVYYLSQYTKELADAHGISEEEPDVVMDPDALTELAQRVLGDYLIWES